MAEIPTGNVSYGDGETALANEILRTTVGSGVHGIAIEGSDDLDLMGVFIEPRENVYGLGPALDHYISRTQPEGVRSRPGDVDLVIYSLRKYLRLAIKGNPTALLPLFAPESDIVTQTKLGASLRDMRTLFLSQEAVWRFLGYMHQQHERMLGGGKRNRVPNRPELVEKYGFDVKYAAHALRLAMQGYEIATTGHLSLPMVICDRDLVLAVKRGEVDQEEIYEQVTYFEREIRHILESGQCSLPAAPFTPVLSSWSVTAHETHWRSGRRQ